jgi:hypothetical protein
MVLHRSTTLLCRHQSSLSQSLRPPTVEQMSRMLR